MTNVKPIKLAYKGFEPVGGEDTTLSPIIFLHGVTATKEYWKDIPQIVADTSKRKAYTIDSRNHGDSEYTDEFTFDLNVVDLFHFLESIKATKVILVGHSMGGITAMKAALQKPDRIETIIIEDIFPKKIPKDIIDGLCGFIQLYATSVYNIPKEAAPEEASTFVMDFFCSQLPKDSPFLENRDKLKTLIMDIKRTPEGGYDVKYNKEVVMKGLKNEDALMNEFVGQYNAPAYFIYGNVSQFNVGKEEETIKSHFPKAKLIEFEGATHMVHVEFPEKFAKTVLQCLLK